MGNIDVARRPSDHAIDAYVFGWFAGQLAIFHHLAVFAGVGVVDFRRLQIVGGIHPVQSIRVPGLFIGIVLDLVVGRPLHGDVPVAVTQDAGDQRALGGLGIALPLRRAHQFIFAA